MKLTRDVWLNDLKMKRYGEVKFFHTDFDYDTMMSPMEMIFQHRCATTMLILLNGVISKTPVGKYSIYELFSYHMRADFDVLDKYLCDRDPMSILMANYPKEDFSQKKLDEIIPRLVGFYKDILGAKDENGTPLIALFDKHDTRVRYEFFYTNVRLALAMIKMGSLEFNYEFFELVFSIPTRFTTLEKVIEKFSSRFVENI